MGEASSLPRGHFDTPFKWVVRKAIITYGIRNRRRKTARILAFLERNHIDDVLLVGALGDENAGNSDKAADGYIEKQIAANHPVKMGINITEAVTSYPFQIADVRDMPFDDDYVDFALANAIIEHVGQEPEQRRMVEEMTRVARSWVITTPNRWFPIEAHTSAVFKHWSPSWRQAHPWDFTRLLSRREFSALLPAGAKISGWWLSPTFTATYLRD